MSNVMSFKLNENRELALIKDRVIETMNSMFPITSKANTLNCQKIQPNRKERRFKNKKKGNGFKAFSVALPLAVGVAGNISGAGIFWDVFMTYIFPYFLDVAKVYCVIKIAQGFYEEKRGGRESGSGFGNFVTYGKWLIMFYLIPWGVELIDQLGGKMLTDLKTNPMNGR